MRSANFSHGSMVRRALHSHSTAAAAAASGGATGSIRCAAAAAEAATLPPSARLAPYNRSWLALAAHSSHVQGTSCPCVVLPARRSCTRRLPGSGAAASTPGRTSAGSRPSIDHAPSHSKVARQSPLTKCDESIVHSRPPSGPGTGGALYCSIARRSSAACRQPTPPTSDDAAAALAPGRDMSYT
ncbi:hypothetical protein TSOC_000717 [Tetrabaena socialis]|uniref:Uncharacterized protein n=1 Tax=Tetrabaena socialis TaxID=47790 RepID=A0A2J8AIK7_9CHLO|nr:hypothetical protein TSOC_000717 [Tetrabaena socialis]|eukprot:PNH12345.1 hypothetical protein TSOC_000717 [Tetrabaena socialis]